MNKRNFNVVGNNETENQEFAKGIAFVKSRRAPLNIAQMVMEMNLKTVSNGVLIDTVYADASGVKDYDRKEIGLFFDVIQGTDIEVVVVRSLNEITDDIYDLEEFVKTITDMGIWLYSLEVGPVPITVSHTEDFGC
ncbi:recombinase family protein [Agathobaculum butyriciproducens]|nr:recombinase family protein [Agathobaculum butyriciproducens]